MCPSPRWHRLEGARGVTGTRPRSGLGVPKVRFPSCAKRWDFPGGSGCWYRGPSGAAAEPVSPPRHAGLCGLRLGRAGGSAGGGPQPSRSFLNLTNKRKEYSERRIIG